MVSTVERDNPWSDQASSMGWVVRRRLCLATRIKVSTHTRPSVAFMTSPIHSLVVVNRGKRSWAGGRSEGGNKSLRGRMWFCSGAGGSEGMEGRLGRDNDGSDVSGVSSLEGRVEGSTSLPGRGLDKSGRPVTPKMSSRRDDLMSTCRNVSGEAFWSAL